MDRVAAMVPVAIPRPWLLLWLAPTVLLYLIDVLFQFRLDWLHFVLVQLVLLALFHDYLGLGPVAPSVLQLLGLETLLPPPSPPPLLPSPPRTREGEGEGEDGQEKERAMNGTAADAEEEEEEEAGSSARNGPMLPSTELPTDPRYQSMVRTMIDSFLVSVEASAGTSSSTWVAKVETPDIQVWQKTDAVNVFKVLCHLENTPLTCFDLLSDITRRKLWDSMTEEACIVEEISDNTRIVYVRTKPIWPTSARDLVLLSYRTVLADGRFLNVTKSVEHPKYPDRSAENIVRMEANIGGIICAPSKKRPGACEMIQIAGGDPKGNIPKSIINFVATSAVPKSIQVLNDVLRKCPALDSVRKKTKSALKAVRGTVNGTSAEDILLSQEVQQLTQSIESLRRHRPATGSALQQVQEALQWATPFMIVSIYFFVVYRTFRGSHPSH